MKSNQYLLGLLILFASFSLFGQSQNVTISGKIKDNNSKILPFASVILKTRIDSVFVSGTVTDNQGIFKLADVKPGKYVLEASYISYRKTTINVFIGKINQHLDVGTIELQEDQQTLSEVVVKGERSIVSNVLDKKTYSVENNISQSGGSVMDVMRTLPGITIDPDSKILLRGSDKITVLIDGKQTALTGFGNQKGLDNIPAANIERIEIINNPSAKYNAAGMAGIVNIVYKKDQEKGLQGEAGFNTGVGAISKRKADLPTSLGSFSGNPKYTPSLNLNYNTSKLNFFLQSSILFQKKLPNNEFTTRYYNDGRIIASQVPENREQIHYIIKAGTDWNINENNSITLSGIYDYENHVDTSQVAFINKHLEDSRNRFYSWNEEEVTGFANITLNYKHKFPQPGHLLATNFQFTKGWEDESYFLQDSSSIRQSADTTMLLATEYTTSFSIDYTKPLKSGRIEIGSKLQWRRIPVEYIVGRGENSIIYSGLGDWSKWGENINAAYVNYIFEKPIYNIEAGVRAENTKVFYNIPAENTYYDQNDSYNYFELFPNVRITYHLNERNKLSAFYNRRIDRPGEPELRIFAKYDDPELLKVGNPYLRPQFTQVFELAYNMDLKNGSVYLASYYRIIDNQFLRIYNEDETSAGNIINKVYQNIGSASNTGFELILDQKIKAFWKFSTGINWYINKIMAHEGRLQFPYERTYSLPASKENTWDLKINNQFEFPGNFKIQLTGIYYAASNTPQGRQLARSSMDLGVSKRVIKGKGELTGSFTDLFNRFGIKQEFIGDGFTGFYENFYETQVVRLGFKYKL